MSKKTDVAARFLADTKNHTMSVLREDGTHRHLRFRNNGSMIYGFDLITWPGHLCITGDCGTYVLSRVPDMFEFFRTKPQESRDRLFINPGYWAEKVLAEDRHHGIKEFSLERFREAVVSAFRQQWEGSTDFAAKRECWEAVREEVLNRAEDGEPYAVSAVYDFQHDGFQFVDFFEHDLEEYTHGYLWNLYAIVWGIQQYDQLQSEAA